MTFQPKLLFNALLACTFGLLAADVAHATACRYQCLSAEACTLKHERSGDVLKVDGSRELNPCEPYVGQTGTLSIWYVRSNALVGKMLNVADKSSAALADAASGCQSRLAACLTAVQRSQVPGISPMGEVQEGAEPSGAGTGLPFDEVWQPPEGLQLNAWAPANGDGELTVIDLSTRSPVAQLPVLNGRAQLPPNALREGQRYKYRWVTAAGTVAGSFTAAHARTVERAERVAATAMADEKVQPKTPGMIRAQKWAALGLRWDAQRMLQQSEDKQP